MPSKPRWNGMLAWGGAFSVMSGGTLGCAKPVVRPADDVAVERPVASAPPSEGLKTEPATPKDSLSGASHWLLDVSGTFPNAVDREGAWLVSLVTKAFSEEGAHGEKAANELVANLRVLQAEFKRRGEAPSAEDLAALPGWVSPPEAVWILSEKRPPCRARVDANPRIDFYDRGVPAMEVAYQLTGCDFHGALDVGFSNVQPSAELRWQPARTVYERTPQSEPNPDQPWDHPLARFLVSEPSNRPGAGEYTPPKRSIRLLGVDSMPPLLDLFTGIVWDHAPKDEDDYNACSAAIAINHEVGFLDGDQWLPLPRQDDQTVHLAGAITAGSRAEVVIGTRGRRVAILPVTDARSLTARWSVLETGVHRDEAVSFAEPQLGPYCGP